MKNTPTVTIPLSIPDYQVSIRQRQSAAPEGTDTLCIGRLYKNNKPVAAMAPRQRIVHYTVDIQTACHQIVTEFEVYLRKAAARKTAGEGSATIAADINTLAEGVRRIRESGCLINPKHGNKGWIRRTQDSYLAIFVSQIAPLLTTYVAGEEAFLPSDLETIQKELAKKKAKSVRSGGRQEDIHASVYADLSAADVIYRFLRDAYPDLRLPEISLAPASRRGMGARKEQRKSIPEPVRQALCRYIEAHWRQEPRCCYAMTLMLCGGLRTAEAAGTRPSKIEFAATYGLVKVHAQEKDGKIESKLKRDDSYRSVVVGCWACSILHQCMAEIRKTDPNWENDESVPACLTQDLSPWVLARLRECGLSEAYLAEARKNYEEAIMYDKDGNLVEDFTAYVLRRDWASRARNICGYTSIEIDQQLGHKVIVPKRNRPNLKLTSEQGRLAVKAERYVYAPAVTHNPGYSPIMLEVGSRMEIPTYTAVKYCNSSDKPMLVALTFSAQENADAVKVIAPRNAIQRPVVTSVPDNPTKRQNRPIIGDQTKEV